MDSKYVYKNKASLGHYKADVYAVRCFDNRFWKSFKNFIKDNAGIGDIDTASPAGGAKVFSSPFKETDKEHYLEELGRSISLHHVGKVLLFTHHDCGAYGGFAKFDNDADKELEFHKAEHRKAVAVILERFPDLVVETYFIDDEGIIKTSE